jgi:cytidylate kinase
MSLITISRRTYSRGKDIAVQVAGVLGYECVGREVLQYASREYGVPEDKLYKAIHEAPSFFGMTLQSRKQYIAYVKAAFAAFMVKDNVVYHGPAGELLIRGVSHLLKVRIIADFEERLALKIERDKVPEKEARKALHHDDDQHVKLMKWVYGRDDTDAALYDLAINVSQIGVEKAVDMITGTVKLNRFQPVSYSLKLMKSIELSLRISAHLVDTDPDIRVHSVEGNIHVHTKAIGTAKKKNVEIIKKRVLELPGVKSVKVHMSEDLFERIAGRMP